MVIHLEKFKELLQESTVEEGSKAVISDHWVIHLPTDSANIRANLEYRRNIFGGLKGHVRVVSHNMIFTVVGRKNMLVAYTDRGEHLGHCSIGGRHEDTVNFWNLSPSNKKLVNGVTGTLSQVIQELG